MKLTYHPLFLAISFGMISIASQAQEPQVVGANQAADIQTTNALPTIVVTAHPLNDKAVDLAAPVNVVDKNQLIAGGSTLGYALENQVGIHVDSYGGGASRPVIRGQNAPRVKVLSDGAEVMDASNVSPDHAVTVDPLLADKVEVLRGPSTLLYGGGAIGGVVNVLDNEIPTKMPQNGLEGEVGLRGNTSARERAGAAAVTVGLGDQVALHVEGLKRDADSYKSGASNDRIPGTYTEGASGSVGASWITDQGFTGLSFTRKHDDYGLAGDAEEFSICAPDGTHLKCDPSLAQATPASGYLHHGEPGAWVRLDSKRVDLRSEYKDPFEGFSKIKIRSSYTDYKHDEMDNGQAATSFMNKGYDGRIELTHKPIDGVEGVVGMQYNHSDFSTSGEEGFLPDTITKTLSAFFLEHYQWNDLHFEFGGRHEWQNINPNSDNPKFSQQNSDLQATSVSGSASWTFIPHYALALSLSHSERLPNAQELYANGPHFATLTYETGNPNLHKEKSNNIEVSLKKVVGDLTFGLSAYHNQIGDYIYAKTLDQYQDFRLIQYAQQDATFNGVEGELSYRINPNYKATVFGDYVRAKLDNGGGNLPRIPAGRVGARMQADWDAISGSLEAYHVFEQHDIANFETQGKAYDIINASLAYDGNYNGTMDYHAFLQLGNLLNKTYYNHGSFLPNLPLQGRNLTAGVQFKF